MDLNKPLAMSLLALLPCLTGCTSPSRQPPGLTQKAPASDAQGLTGFVLRVASSDDHIPLEGASVVIVRADGVRQVVGHTDLDGIVRFESFSLHRGDVLLSCKPRFFCGAIRVGEDLLMPSRRSLLELAPFQVE